ncbi:hypothetical protein [Flagellimonas pacifica]|uniref:DUF4249 family protein n=1 Tax=Flagellimonas pacifica TaxID=1247520 RepID=A0A285MBT3_9FLAO|nr:hypothetical protein [Allomuricauda parva]SNY93446.1 hypothetical protein SAMN06265377_0062 [Allomuricauda parva]
MTLKRLFLFLPILFFLSCINSSDDCSVLCPGLGVLAFDILLDGSNVFDNGTYTINDVTIDDTNTQFSLESLSSPLLLIQDRDWREGDYNYFIRLSNDYSFTVNATFELSDGSECCSPIPVLTAIRINDISQEVPLTDGVATVNL